MIAIFDEDGGGDVDFQEFVSGLSAFSSKGNKEEKLHFAFKVYDIDRDGYISNGELFIVLKMMVGSNLKDVQLQQIVDKTIMEADKDRDGKISFEEFKQIVEKTDVSMTMTLGMFSTCWPSSAYCYDADAYLQIRSEHFRRGLWILLVSFDHSFSCASCLCFVLVDIIIPAQVMVASCFHSFHGSKAYTSTGAWSARIHAIREIIIHLSN